MQKKLNTGISLYCFFSVWIWETTDGNRVMLNLSNVEISFEGFFYQEWPCLIFNWLHLSFNQECKDVLGFNLAAMDHLKVCIFAYVTFCNYNYFKYKWLKWLLLFDGVQQLMALKSDALFQDAKTKLLEIRAQHSKRIEARTETREEKQRKKKKKKSSDEHAWTWFQS